MRWFRRGRRRTTTSRHYLEHKEAARALIHERLVFFNSHYQLTYKRVAIKNQRRCWGSCSALGNLNFSYRLLFLPPELSDYVIAHELCHLKELNHSNRFWALLAETIPDFRQRKQILKRYDHLPAKEMVLK